MANNLEAAKMLEENIEATNKVLADMNKLLDHLQLDGTEDTTTLEENIKQLKETIARNEETAKHIRETAEE